MINVVISMVNITYYRHFPSSGRNQNVLNVLNEYLPTYVSSLKMLKKLEDEEIEYLYKILTDQYFDGKPINDKKLRKVIDLLTLIYFELPAIITIEDRAKRSTLPTYLCKFSFVGNEISLSDLVVKRHVSGKRDALITSIEQFPIIIFHLFFNDRLLLYNSLF